GFEIIDNEIHFEPCQLGSELWKPLDPALRIAPLDGKVLSLHVAKVPKALKEAVQISPRRDCDHGRETQRFGHLALRLGSLDYLLGSQHQGGRNVKAESLRGFEVHVQLISGWLFHRHIARFFPAQYLIHVPCRLPCHYHEIRSEARETTGHDPFSEAMHRR